LVNVQDFILNLAKELAGEDASNLLKYLMQKKVEITDEDLAKELDEKPNDIRKKLYALSEHGFVTYRRTKDKDSPRYIYYWKVNIDQINDILLNNLFYFCPQDNIKYNMDEAFENEFKCPKCGSALQYYDSEKARKFLEEKIKQLEEEIERETKRGANSS
jgi:transcription initiation factor TFIIE subunit alpha